MRHGLYSFRVSIKRARMASGTELSFVTAAVNPARTINLSSVRPCQERTERTQAERGARGGWLERLQRQTRSGGGLAGDKAFRRGNRRRAIPFDIGDGPRDGFAILGPRRAHPMGQQNPANRRRGAGDEEPDA